MKQKNLFKTLFASMVISLFMPLTANAQISINSTNFPDDNFRNYLQRQDFGKDGVLTEAEIKEITVLYTGYQNISSLKGIEYFTELTDLHCYGNQLTTLDVSRNTKLIKLYCYDNQLTTLNVSGCKTLTDIDCYHNMIKGEGMDAFISSLPEKSTGERASIFMYNDIKGNEGNVCTTFQVSAALKKGWSPLYCTEISEDGLSYKWTLYEGTNDDSTASDSIAINSTNFPDENFRNYLLWQDYGKDRILTKEEIKEITAIYISGWNVSSLKGIEYFTNLNNLQCADNHLTSLDVSGCKALTNIICYHNMIKGEAMDAFINSLPQRVPGEYASILIYNDIEGDEGNIITQNQIDAAEIKGWTPLYCESIDENGKSSWNSYDITIEINETNFPDENFRNYLLEQYYGYDGIITKNEIKYITYINVENKNISSLKGIEYFTELKTLDCQYNQLTSLNVSKNTELTFLDCYENQLTSLDVSNNTMLEYLYCDNNQLTSLDASKNIELTQLTCSENQLTTLKLPNSTKLIYLECSYNQLTSLDVSQNTELIYIGCMENQLTSLDVSKNTALTTLYCEDNQLTSLDVSENILLTSLACGYNQLTSLDVSQNTAFTYLSCSNNQLTSLDISNNTELIILYCYANQIKGEEMDKLIESLPQNTTDEERPLCIYDNMRFDEGNVCTKEQVLAVKAKGWTPKYYDGTEWIEYEGSDDESVGILSPNKTTDNINAPVYNISGQRIDMPHRSADGSLQGKKGIYIINGKKVVIK